MKIERPQPIVIGINEKGELIWSNMEMPMWQKRMFPIRYVGDFRAFWIKLSMMQGMDLVLEGGHNAQFTHYVPAEYEKKYKAKRKNHKGD
jgi:hypothetical protein